MRTFQTIMSVLAIITCAVCILGLGRLYLMYKEEALGRRFLTNMLRCVGFMQIMIGLLLASFASTWWTAVLKAIPLVPLGLLFVFGAGALVRHTHGVEK